ncbi:MAG TPA: HD domain-containing phosphohydrolase [Gemmatimonadales bacterium]|jgi:HD-GYP domain-containing protein (c-di-GMP phosphodiesterase class II)
MTASLVSTTPVRESAYRTSEILSALSCALDITEGQPPGHAVRTCLIGMHLAERAGMPAEQRGPLFYALLLKDLGCSSNAARLCSLFGADDRALKRDHKLTDWSRPSRSLRYALRNAVPSASPMGRAVRVASMVMHERGSGREMTRTRCDRGAEIAGTLGFTAATGEAIRTLDEHWDGNGMPDGLSGSAIPLLGRIVGLAQTAEIFASTFGVDAAVEVIVERRGRWFDPSLVDAFRSLAEHEAFWAKVLGRSPERHLNTLEPEDQVVMADEARLDDIARAFARVIDAKSPYTYLHSERVAELAVTIGRGLHFSEVQLRDIRRAGLLHDIGKLGVSTLILDKPERLTERERAEVRVHPAYTQRILERVGAFSGIVAIASAHHERLDGKGYHLGLTGERLSPMSRALAVADVYEATTADRPYRKGLPRNEAIAILRGLAGTALCPSAVEALASEVG